MTSNINSMGMLELLKLQEKVFNSMLDAEQKDRLLREIDERKSKLNVDTSFAEAGEVSISEYDDIFQG